MTGDDYRWEHMSVIERCEVLREGQARIERAVDRLRANKATLDWAEGIDRAMANLLGRVAEIEKGHTETMLGHFHGNHARADEPLSPAPVVPVYPEELARLLRIEEAARELVDTGNSIYRHTFPSMARKLMAALDSEPER